MTKRVEKKFLGSMSLALLQIAIVGNLQILPANASYGLLLPILYLIGIVGFFIPCLLMVAELATTHPQTGGAYIWCEEAFGKRTGFFTVTILWISNLLWYPSILSFIASNFAYIVDPALATNQYFIITFGILFFWFFTGLNCVGVNFSSKTSMFCSVIGIIIPMLVITLGGVYWWYQGEPLALTPVASPWTTVLTDLSGGGLVIAIVISLFGIELTAVHAGNVFSPKRDYPKSLLISSILIVCLLLSSEMTIAAIIPASHLNMITGLLDTIQILFKEMHFDYLVKLFLFMILLGATGSISAWMLGSTRAMFIACQENHVSTFLQKENRFQAPIGILMFEAVIFTLTSMIFLLFPHISDSFWLLLDLASQITLIYYVILFASAIKLRYQQHPHRNGFMVPGGNKVMWCVMGVGMLTAVLALFSGFIAPSTLDKESVLQFHEIIVFGIFIAIGIPLSLLYCQGVGEGY